MIQHATVRTRRRPVWHIGAVRANILVATCDVSDRWCHIPYRSGISRVYYRIHIVNNGCCWTCDVRNSVEMSVGMVFKIILFANGC